MGRRGWTARGRRMDEQSNTEAENAENGEDSSDTQCATDCVGGRSVAGVEHDLLLGQHFGDGV